MPKITVELISPLSNQAKWRNRDFVVCSLIDVICLLVESFPIEIREKYFEISTSMPKPFLLFLLNGEDVRQKNGFETLLHDGDRLQVAVALGGG